MGYRVAVVGATGNVGREMLNILEELKFPVDKIHAIASRKSIGVEVSFGDRILKCEDIAQFDFASVDLVLSRIPFNQFPGGGANSRAIGNVLEQNYSTSLTGSQANFYSQLLQSSAPNTLSQLTGEVATAAQNASFAVFGQFFSTILDQTCIFQRSRPGIPKLSRPYIPT